MKWVTVAGILLYLSRCNDAAVLKCSSESQDPLCASEKRDISHPPSAPDAECLAGSEWESNCHFCRCSDTGIAECLKQDSCDLQIFEEPIKCKPFTSFRRDCNTCTCMENGLGLCTLIGCVGPMDTDRRKRQTGVQDNEKQCKPGSKWKESCNSCWCTDDGVSICTEMGCIEDNSASSIQKRDTSKAGADHIERHSVCKPRDTFYVSCNICHCNQYGTDYSCSNKPCPLPKDVEIFHELKVSTTQSSNNTKRVVCVANRMFIMDCNTCWCNEDGTSFFCTRRICTPDSSEDNATEKSDEVKLREVKKVCSPNEVFKKDCNMCRCDAEGISYSCTRRACVEFHNKNDTLTRKKRAAQEPPKTCQPGAEFRLDCNKCLCNDEGQDYSCTRIDCAAQNGNGGIDTFGGARRKRETSETVAMQCAAGEVFHRDCNVCRCTEDGLHAVCTLKRCKQDAANDTEPTPSFRCTPGDQFKRDCNDCTCSADGKTVFCTLRLCDTELNDMASGQ